MQNEVKRGHRPLSYVVEKFGLCDGLCKTVNDH